MHAIQGVPLFTAGDNADFADNALGAKAQGEDVKCARRDGFPDGEPHPVL